MVSFQWIWLSSMLAIAQARTNSHHHDHLHDRHRAFSLTVNSTSTTSNSSLSTATSTAVPTTPVYGSVVDYNDTKPAYNQTPGTLPNRTASSINVTGVYTLPWAGSLGGSELLFDYGQYLNLTGTGYFMIRWEIGFFNNRCGWLQPPFWYGLKGKLFHVASGGGRRMDDAVNYNIPDEAPAGAKTWMGDEDPDCLIVLPAGMQQMWMDEFYYLDGSVTLYENEGWADYNLGYTAVTWQDIHNNVNTKPDGAAKKRYGIVRDTGKDDTPVPQYLTRLQTSNFTLIPQKSVV